jgi:hypothetical protein
MENLPIDIIKIILKYSKSLFYTNKKYYLLITQRKIKFTKNIKNNKEINVKKIIQYTLKIDTLIELNLESCNLKENALLYVSRLKYLEILNISNCINITYNHLFLLHNLINLKILIISTNIFPKRLIEIFKSKWENKYNLKIIIKNIKQ